MKIIKYIIIFLFLVSINSSMADASALTLLGSDNKSISSDCLDSGNCSIEELVSVGTQLFNMILGVVGSLALLMFIYGGFSFLISQGDSGKVSTAKEIIKNAIIGLIIVFASVAIVNLTKQAIFGS